MNKKTIENIFKATQAELKSALETDLTGGGREILSQDGFLYSKGTHPVLLVAHMDTVHKESPKTILYSKDGNTIMSLEGIGGDDRCGIIMILEILQKYDCSVVFLEDEEIGCVGARKFCKAGIDLGDINYAVEFDRKGGNDYVFYKDYNKDFEAHIKKFGFVKATGSCSDISHIAPTFKIEAVNISCGYYCPHCWYEYVKLDEMYDIIERATKMIGTKTKKFEYAEPTVVKYTTTPRTNISYFDDDYYTSNYYKDWCNSYTKKKKEDDPVWLTDEDVILIVGGKQKENFGKIYMDNKSKLYWDSKLTNGIKDGFAIGRKSHYSCTYWGASRDFPDQLYKLDGGISDDLPPYYIDKGQAKLVHDGKEEDFVRVFMDSNGDLYQDIWLTKKLNKTARLVENETLVDLDYSAIAVLFPQQSYKLNRGGAKK
jgi:hypothetical protein